MQGLILKIDIKDADALAAVRCIDGLQAAVQDQYIWLSGISSLAEMDSRLKQLPVKSTFIVDEQDHLFLPGGLTPVDKLKSLQWLPLNEFIKVDMPVAALPGKTSGQVAIRLIVSDQEKAGEAIITTLNIWKVYAETAPAVRLQAIQFAVSESGAVLIIGSPLPPLPGKEYWMDEGILLPCGYEFEIPLAATFVKNRMNKNNDTVIVFDTAGNWLQIDKAFFVQGKRSAVRLTNLHHD